MEKISIKSKTAKSYEQIHPVMAYMQLTRCHFLEISFLLFCKCGFCKVEATIPQVFLKTPVVRIN